MRGRWHRASAVGTLSLAAAVALGTLCGSYGVTAASRLSLNGTSGLLMTPTADLIQDRDLAVGGNFVDKKWAVDQRGVSNAYAYFATLGYLPRLEISMRLTVFPGASFSAEKPDRSLKDRMLSVKVLLLREGDSWPALALGGEDLVGTKRLHTLFAVAGKRVSLGRAGELGLHLGGGADWVNAKNHPLVGVFGGLVKRLWKGGELLAEYDTEKVNVGLGVEPVPYLRVLLSMLNIETFAGELHVQFML